MCAWGEGVVLGMKDGKGPDIYLCLCNYSHLAHSPDCPVCERQPAVEISGDGHEEAVLFVRHFGMPSRSAKKIRENYPGRRCRLGFKIRCKGYYSGMHNWKVAFALCQQMLFGTKFNEKS